MLYRMVLTFESVDKIIRCDQMKTKEQYFLVVLLILSGLFYRINYSQAKKTGSGTDVNNYFFTSTTFYYVNLQFLLSFIVSFQGTNFT